MAIDKAKSGVPANARRRLSGGASFVPACSLAAMPGDRCDAAAEGFVAVDWQGDFFDLDIATGQPTVVGHSGFEDCKAMAADCRGRIFVASSGLEGEHSILLIAPIDHFIPGLAFDGAGTLFFIEAAGEERIGTIDPETGVPTIIGGQGLEGAVQTIAFDSSGRMVAAWGACP